MVKAFKAGLILLTALASTMPAMAQERGGWGGRGMDGNAGVRAATGGGMGGNAGVREATRGDGEGRGWRGNGGAAAQPGAQAGGQPSAQVGTQGEARGWRGDSNRQDRQGQGGWQGGAPRADVAQTPRVDPNPGNTPGAGRWNGDRNGSRTNDGQNWQGRAANRDDGRRWNGNGVNNGYSGGTINRAYGNPNDGNRNFNRGGGNWQGGNWQGGGRIDANDRWRDQHRWNRDWRRDNRYDWSGYRQSNRNAYRLPAYRAPYGWNGGYSRFSIGVYLGNSLFGSSYWIDDPYSYRLPAAYGTLRWVRYYDDALLVDIRDGYVVDVIHDVFW